MPRELHDFYFKEAKREGYRSRAAYKLIEIDDRRKLLRPGNIVLDCGAAPGSWMQVAARRVGRRGFVLGIDLKPIAQDFQESNVCAIEGDCLHISRTEIESAIADSASGFESFDVVLSDMAPGTTGDPQGDHHRSIRLCEALLHRLGRLLTPGGRFVMKVFEGPAYRDLLSTAHRAFEDCKGFVPKASRNESREIYIVGLGFDPSGLAHGQDSMQAPERKSRKRGWS